MRSINADDIINFGLILVNINDLFRLNWLALDKLQRNTTKKQQHVFILVGVLPLYDVYFYNKIEANQFVMWSLQNHNEYCWNLWTSSISSPLILMSRGRFKNKYGFKLTIICSIYLSYTLTVFVYNRWSYLIAFKKQTNWMADGCPFVYWIYIR